MKKIFITLLLFSIVLSCSKKDVEPVKSSSKTMLSFSFDSFSPAIKGTIDSVKNTVSVILPIGADASKLAPTISVSKNAVISPATNVIQDFTKPFIYKITAEDGSSIDYIVTATVKKSSEKKIISFDYNDITPNVKGIIDETKKEVTVTLPAGTILENLKPTIKISDRATIILSTIASGSLYKRFNYLVTAEDGSKQEYIVTVTVEPSPNSTLFVISDTELYALDGKTGTTIWKFDSKNTISSSCPTIEKGIVYFGNKDGYIFALDIKTGQEKKKYKLDDWYSESAPIIKNNIMYLNILFVGIIALDLNTGQKKWSFSDAGNSTFSNLLLFNEVAYFGASDGYFYALNAADGKVKWKYKNASLNRTSSPCLGYTNAVTICFGTREGPVISLNAISGALVWKANIPGNTVLSSPTAPTTQSSLHIASDKTMYSINMKDGSINWSYETLNTTWSSPFVDNDELFFISTSAFKLNASTGKLNWKANILNNGKSSPIKNYDEGLVYFKDSFGEISAYGTNDGKLVWNKALKNDLEGGMAIIDSKGEATYSSISGNRN
jgi:eukaryotic-like serine/threonine-protein kinase